MFIAELFNGAPKAPNEQPESGIDESSQPKLVVLYPGRFQPFHLGHGDVFNTLSAKFGRNNVYISTSNKTEAGRSPFSFADKMIFMIAAGIPVDRILEVKSPYKLPEQFDAENTILIDVVGAPDADRLRPGTYKKDGQPGYYQKFESLDKCETADKHGYVIVAAERKKTVTIAGKTYDASHGTEVRKLWNSIRNRPQQRAEFVTQMFGSPDPEIARLLDKIDLNEDSNMPVAVDSTSPIHGGINESDEFASSNRVADNIKRSKHPFADLGVDFDDYEQVIDLIDHCAVVVNTDPADSNEMAEIFMWTLGQKYGGAQVYDVIEGIIQGYRSINDDETVALLHRALEKDWMQTGEKPFKAVNNLIVVLGKALYAVEDASGEQSLKPWGRELDENDDNLFADSKTEKVAKALLGYAAELKSDYEAADPSWEDHWSQKRVIDKIDYAKRLAEKFRGPNGMIRALNIIAVNLNDRDAPMFKREAIWEADDYIQDKIGFGWAELFQTYEDELDESEVA
jgi:cytidyltransferase-like protein